MYLFKHLKSKFLVDFKEKGSIKINTLQKLRSDESIGDALEGLQERVVAPQNQSLTFSSDRTHNLLPGVSFQGYTPTALGVEPGGTVKSIYEVSDAHVLCTSLKPNTEYWEQFGYDAFYRIIKPYKFAKLLHRKLNMTFGLKAPPQCEMVKYTKKVEYATTISDIEAISKPPKSLRELCFTKEEKFSVQMEFRMLFLPKHPSGIRWEAFDCPELRRCCEF